MKKIAKISLVAAVAVAGLTTANAQPLEEAIKNVDVSGSVVYRYNDYADQQTTTPSSFDKSENNYKVGVNLSSKVNDDVKFNTRLLAGTPSVLSQAGTGTAVGTSNNGFATLNTSTNSDQNVEVQLSTANFAYTGLKNTTVTVGKQGLVTPYTTGVMIDENEQTGTGILALSTVGPVTLGAAYFNQTNLDKSGETDIKAALNGNANNGNAGASDIAALAAIANLGKVTVDAWYLEMPDFFNTYTLGAKSEFALSNVTLGTTARYASLNTDWDQTNPKNDIIKVGLTAKAGIFGGSADYAKTNKEGGITGLDSDASTVLKGWNLHTLNKTDADYYKLMAGVDILSNLTLSANYGNLQYITTTADVEEEELYGQLTYKMSKNLSTYVRYGSYTKDNTTRATGGTANEISADMGRLQVAYTF